MVCSTSSAPRKPAGQVISLWCCCRCRAAASRFRFLRLKVGRSRVRHTLRLSLGLSRIAKKGPGAWRLDLLDLISSLPSTLHSISSSCFACFPSTLNLNHRPNRTNLLTLNLTPTRRVSSRGTWWCTSVSSTLDLEPDHQQTNKPPRCLPSSHRGNIGNASSMPTATSTRIAATFPFGIPRYAPLPSSHPPPPTTTNPHPDRPNRQMVPLPRPRPVHLPLPHHRLLPRQKAHPREPAPSRLPPRTPPLPPPRTPNNLPNNINQFLVPRSQLAQTDPRYRWPNAAPYYPNVNPNGAPAYGMHSMAPPPVYDPNSARPPVYPGPPESGGSKIDPNQGGGMMGGGGGEASPSYAAATAPPQGQQQTGQQAGVVENNNPYRL